MSSRTPTLRTWLLSVAAHACVLIAGQLFVQRSTGDSACGQVLLAFVPAPAMPERESRPSESDRIPVIPSTLPEPRPVPIPPAQEESPLLEQEAPLSPMPAHDRALFAALGFEPIERLRVPAPRAVPEPTALPPAPMPTSPPAAEPGQPQVTAPVALHRPWPGYPRTSLRLSEEGSVLLRIEIAADGQVRAATIEASSGFARLDRAARAAVYTWRFRPALRDGSAVAWTIRQRITFELSGHGASSTH